jgi:death-on-curing protein
VDAVRYLTVDQVIEFHGEALREFGGLDGIRSQHQLSAAVQMPQQSAFGEDAYPSIPEKAAAYGFFIAEAQAFIDGNKRAAAIAMEAFLILNAYELRMSDDDIADLFERLGSDEIGQGEFFDAISSQAHPVNPETRDDREGP